MLIGIADYSLSPLEGPPYDVAALQNILPRWGFAPQNIKTLKEQQATRVNILNALRELAASAQAGDHILVYFSGHGTSVEDDQFGSFLPLPHTSGALVPVDFAPTKLDTPESLTQNLIIGKEDILPIFRQMDGKGAYVLAIFDACYTGNTVRSFKSTLKERRLDLRAFARIDTSSSQQINQLPGGANSQRPRTEPYPYKHIAYLGAASESQPAADIGKAEAAQLTIDGKPHGAFTDTLLRVLQGEIGADANGDGALSPAELDAVVRPLVSSKYGHTPQILPSLRDSSSALRTSNFFSSSARVLAQPSPVPGFIAKLSLWVDDTFSGTLKGLGRVPGITLSNDRGYTDLKAVRDGADVLLVLPNNHPLVRYRGKSELELQQALAQQAAVQPLRALRHSNTELQIQLEREGSGTDSTAVEGSLVGFSVRANQPVYYLALDIDPEGQISVLYPYNNAELRQIPANAVVDLGGQIIVKGPFGTDYVKIFAFTQLPPTLQQWVGRTNITPSDPSFAALSCLVGLASVANSNCSTTGIADATFTLTTYSTAEYNKTAAQ